VWLCSCRVDFAVLSWIAGGHFLVGLRDGALGSILMDVQVGAT
jgi:hypothetical protein